MTTRSEWLALSDAEKQERLAQLPSLVAELTAEAGYFFGVVRRLGSEVVITPLQITGTEKTPGTVAGWVLRDAIRRLPTWSYIHGSHIHHYRVVDVLGQEWYGQGSVGLTIRLKRAKAH